MERRTFLKNLAAFGLLPSFDLACLSARDHATNRRKPRHLLIAYSWARQSSEELGLCPAC